MDIAAVESIVEAILRADACGEPIGPAGLTLLLRRYAATGRTDIRDALERGLPAALDARPPATDAAAADWLTVLCDAMAVADDERIAGAVSERAAALRAAWPSQGSVACALRGVGACLAAAQVLEQDARDLLPAAVDELERIVCRVYQPGEALARSLARSDEPDGGPIEHVAAASALLVAYGATGRLPYAMLAEEIAQPAVGLDADDFTLRCDAARLFLRLALLHDDESYRSSAVIARDRNYRGEARRLLELLTPLGASRGAAAAIYGVALDEFLAPS